MSPLIPRHSRDVDGLALVVVLWVTALLAILASGLTRTVATEARVTQNLAVDAKRDALQTAAGHFVAARLSASGDMNGSELFGRPLEWQFRDSSVVVRVFPETGFIDLNLAGRELLERLIRRAGGFEEANARAVVDAMLDWRDTDHARHDSGAEDPDYADREMPWGAKDGPFEAVAELRGVKGVTAELYRRIAPLVTVHGSRRVNGAQSPPEVLLVLGEDREVVEGYLEQRSAEGAAPPPPPGPHLGGAEVGRAFRVLMTLDVGPSQPPVERQSTILLAGAGSDRLRVVPHPFAAPATDDLAGEVD